MKKLSLAAITGTLIGISVGGLALLVGTHMIVFHDHITAIELLEVLIVSAMLFVVIGLSLLRQHLLHKQSYLAVCQEKNSAEGQLNEKNTQFDNLFHHTKAGVILSELNGKLSRVNVSLCELLGYQEAELMQMNFYYLLHPNALSKLQLQIQRLIDKAVAVHQSEQQLFHKNGEMLWVLLTMSVVRDKREKPLSFVMQVQDITLQKKAEDRLRHMAYHDALTGLANRNKLEQFISHMLASARRHQSSFALLFLDIDRFKIINDTMGHDAGDLLLQVIAERLNSAVRSNDMVARIGGDEFVVLITDVQKTGSVALIAQKILENILKVVMVKGQEIYTTGSIGISMFPSDGQNMETLMKNADLALYRAKEQSRNSYQFYSPEMTSRAHQNMALQNALGHALVKNEFFLNYQPKMDIVSGKLTGFEALLRWENTEYATITPDEIISLAEETGLIIPVSDWVMKTACKELKHLHDRGFDNLTVSVNCSSRQFKQSTFVDDVLSILKKTRLPAYALELEITESTIMQDRENILRILYELKDIGVQIAIDDFGTGYWSLNNIRRLKINKIKIDTSFVKQMVNDEPSLAITSAIIAMANKLGIRSIAEGVETRQQYEFLAKEGCSEIQGYYLSRPLTAEALEQFVQSPVTLGVPAPTPTPKTTA